MRGIIVGCPKEAKTHQGYDRLIPEHLFVGSLWCDKHPSRCSALGGCRDKISPRGGLVVARKREQADGPECVSWSWRYQRPIDWPVGWIFDNWGKLASTAADPFPVRPLERIGDCAGRIDGQAVFAIVTVLRNDLACDFPEASLAIRIGRRTPDLFGQNARSSVTAKDGLQRLTMSATVFLLMPRSRAIHR